MKPPRQMPIKSSAADSVKSSPCVIWLIYEDKTLDFHDRSRAVKTARESAIRSRAKTYRRDLNRPEQFAKHTRRCHPKATIKQAAGRRHFGLLRKPDSACGHDRRTAVGRSRAACRSRTAIPTFGRGALATRRLAAWCRAAAGGDQALFERRLARDGLSHCESQSAARLRPTARAPAQLRLPASRGRRLDFGRVGRPRRPAAARRKHGCCAGRPALRLRAAPGAGRRRSAGATCGLGLGTRAWSA